MSSCDEIRETWPDHGEGWRDSASLATRDRGGMSERQVTWVGLGFCFLIGLSLSTVWGLRHIMDLLQAGCGQ